MNRRVSTRRRVPVALRRVAAAVLTAFCVNAIAQEFTVRDIRVEGVQRTEAGNRLQLPADARRRPLRSGAGHRRPSALCMRSGLFKDVQLEVDGDVLVVVVEERPARRRRRTRRRQGVRQGPGRQVAARCRPRGRPHLRSLAARAVRAGTAAPVPVARPVRRRGQDDGDADRAKSRQCLDGRERGRQSSRIRSITFTGNNVFSDSTLRDAMELTTPNWLSWYSKRDQYSRQKLGADLESLRSFYLNRGFLDFRLESTQVSISPDKNDIYININIFEGDRYTVSGDQAIGRTARPRRGTQRSDRRDAGRSLQRRATQRRSASESPIA